LGVEINGRCISEIKCTSKGGTVCGIMDDRIVLKSVVGEHNGQILSKKNGATHGC